MFPETLHNTFKAFKYRNYRLWFIGQVVSLFGTWMQNTAQNFLIYELTHSPAYLGYVGFAAGLPSWVFMLAGGAVADRIPRRKLMIVTQTAMMLLAFILAALTILRIVQPWHILALATILGIVNAFDAPARLALVPELVEDRADLGNAIALNATMFNIATVLGPTFAGIIYAYFGPCWCFTLNGVSFLAVIAALALMHTNQTTTPTRRDTAGGFAKEIKIGLQFVLTHPVVLALTLLVGLVAMFGMSFQTLMPAWAVNILHGDVKTNSLLRSAQGLGSLIGALTIASLGRFRFKGKLLTIGTFVMPVLLLLFSTVRNIPLALLTLVGIGIFAIFIMNMANILVQSNVPDDLRGRVMSIYSMIFFGFMPIGSFLMGQIAEIWNEPLALLIGGGAVLLTAIGLYLFIPQIRKLA